MQLLLRPLFFALELLSLNIPVHAQQLTRLKG